MRKALDKHKKKLLKISDTYLTLPADNHISEKQGELSPLSANIIPGQ